MQAKPDDIPQDIWDLAESHRKPWVESGYSIKEYVARVIMSERDGCATLVASIIEVSASSYHAKKIYELLLAPPQHPPQ